LTSFPRLPPPSQASASRRWIFLTSQHCCPLLHFRRIKIPGCGPLRRFDVVLHLPRTQERAGGGFVAFQRRSCVLHLPCRQLRAGGGSLHISPPFLRLPPPSHARASWSWIFLTSRRCCPLLHLPRMQKHVEGGLFSRFDAVSPYWDTSASTHDTSSLPSQDCTAMSIDTSTALARFIGCLRWGNTREKVAYPRVFRNPYPNPSKPLPLGTGAGSRGYGYG